MMILFSLVTFLVTVVFASDLVCYVFCSGLIVAESRMNTFLLAATRRFAKTSQFFCSR